MTKEDKKAVECLKKQYKQSAEKKGTTLTIYLVKVKRILELIEKQEQEIEELKKPRYVYTAETNEIKEIGKENCISKDKIREKLNQIHNEFSNILLDKTLSLEEQNLNAHRYDAIRNVLEELLEEN